MGQDIRIRVLSGDSGHPVTNECLNVAVVGEPSVNVIIPTNKDGIALLRLGGNPASQAGGRCRYGAVPYPAVAHATVVRVVGDHYMICQAHPPGTPWLSFSVGEILKSGDSSANSCGKAEASPKPGELILFVKPLHWWQHD